MSSRSASWLAQAVHNRLVALVLAMVAIVPLAAYPGGSLTSVVVVEGFAIVLFATLLWRSGWAFGCGGLKAFLRTGPNLPILALVALATVSCAWSPSRTYALQETLRLCAGVMLYFVVAYQFKRSEHLAKLLDTLLCVGIVVSLLGFSQLTLADAARAGGPFGNANLLGGFLMLLLPIVSAVALADRSAWRQTVAQIAAVLMIAAILVSQTRSAWVGSAAALVVLGALVLAASGRRGERGPSPRKHELVVPAMVIAAAVALFWLVWPQSNDLLRRSGTLLRPTSTASWEWRQKAADGALAMFRAHPLTGVGIGQYPLNQAAFTNLGIDLRGTGARPSMSENAHNLYLQTLAELGAPGLLLLVLVILAFLYSAVGRATTMDPGIRRNLLMGAIASVAAFAVDALSNPAWTVAQTSVFPWLVLGMGVGCLRAPARRRDEAPVRRPVPSALTRPATILAAMALASLLTSVTVAADTPYRVSLNSGDVVPAEGSIKSGLAKAYAYLATFRMSDGSISDPADVTAEASWSKVAGKGSMTGPFGNVYQSKPRTPETAMVMGEYAFGGPTISKTATLTVYR